MEKSELIKCLRSLNLQNVKDSGYCNFLESTLGEAYEQLRISRELIIDNIKNVTIHNFSEDVKDLEWQYICLGFFLIKLLCEESKKSDEAFLSVQETKDLKIFFKNIIVVGICTRLQPNLPFYIKSQYFPSADIFWNYNILKCTTFGLTELLKVPFLRFIILSEHLKEILIALYQISYCPLKKPSEDVIQGKEQVITKELYEKLVKEKTFFLEILNHLKQSIHPHIFVKETMVILHKNSPMWLKKQVSHNLTNILRSKDGVQIVATALFSDYNINTGQHWKILDIFSKLILDCKRFSDFQENICKQLINFLHKDSNQQSVAERIFTHCTKSLYSQDAELCKSVFVREIITPFLHFTYKSHKFKQEDVTECVKLTSRMLHAVFVDNVADETPLPVNIITPIVNVIFRFYVVTQVSSLKTVNNDFKEVLLLYLESQQKNYNNLFDIILFNKTSKEILPFRNDVEIITNENSIKIKISQHSIQSSLTESCESIYTLIASKPELLVAFFGFLLNCITNEAKYFQKDNDLLVQVEDEIASIYFERKIVIYKLLAQLAEDKYVRKQLKENPGTIIGYINTVLKRTLELSTHLTDCDSDGFQSVFTILMILENMLENSVKSNLKYYYVLTEYLNKIHEETTNKEMRDILRRILNLLESSDINDAKPEQEDVKTELDKIIDDVCDPLLPTRGHGLICLTKLIEKKDKDVMARKQFILNVLQQNITNDDSFIYLSAINGLAAMADIFPDTILKLLCEEYSDSSRNTTEDYSEVRMKLGEVLVKISKTLGEMAPKYKPLLLNTFLIGTKDNDDLIRSSSLSNLGEICRVLGYKLGSMFTEVLACVHAIIATDKSPQARRAAVTVIRQLFVGLDQEIISFFKEDILPVYRTLKQIYNNDKDDVMRLQAQLALEELNESMRHFVFPNPQLNFEKNIVMLD